MAGIHRSPCFLVLIVFVPAACTPASEPPPIAPQAALPSPLPTSAAPPSPTAPPSPVPSPEPTATIASSRAITGSVELGDITMYFAQYGQGEPLIMLHAGLGSGDDFARQIPAFARSYQVISPDTRGKGRTTDSAAPMSYHLMAEDTVRLMDHLKIDKAHILGWSDGANTGIDLAIHHPDRVRSLAAYGANISPGGLRDDVASYFRDAASAELQKTLGDQYLRLSSTPDHLGELVEKHRAMWLEQPNFTPEELGSIRAPVLVLGGETEEVIKPEHAREIAATIPRADLILMPGVGHYAPATRAAQFNKIVAEWLQVRTR